MSRHPIESIRLNRRALGAMALSGCAGLSALCGCQNMPSFSSLNPFADPDKAVVANVKKALNGEEGQSRLVGDYITVRSGLQMYMIEGIGLVTGLAGTGGDAGPPHRERLLAEMRRRRVPRPEELLRSPDTALVIVRAYVPPLVRKGDRLDVEIRVPEGSEATSLRGGILLETDLTELAFAPGRGLLEGRNLAKAAGPILGDDVTAAGTQGAFLRGRIPAGAVYTGKERDLSVQLLRDYANARMSTRIADQIGKRFHDYDLSGIQKPLAEAKTHSQIQLKVHSRYLDNYPRYLQCIRHIQLRESSVERNLRIERLGQELLAGPTAAQASLELEAIGRDALPILKAGLQASSAESRFHAAQALAYLGDTTGVPALAEAVAQEPAFRVYALAALASTRSPEAAVALQPLLSHESLETRYGAFRAMTQIAPEDPSVAALPVKGGYKLHILNTTGAPVAHFTERRRSEVVLFGAEQKLVTPLVLRAGRFIMIRSNPAGDRLIVTRIAPGAREQRRETSCLLAEVIHQIDEFGARYPDVVQLLVEADRQGNLSGRLGIDELPQAGRVYQRKDDPAAAGGSTASASVGGVGDTPNLFDKADPSENAVTGPSEEMQEAQEANDPVGFTVR